ncbi:endonuclease [Flagellimonas taeanensis]|jgi:putative endonuclease|uniref:YraN family protein n=1 Tax=Flavobacteriaceae TaxID=49546 RepID=UPI000E686CFD|nr:MULTISPECIES: YraN family protein [Allomuricauda]MDC6383895.1 YraN family protein [Muricauda sp. SK9]RIV48513.1 endonuclease [Allomuricauda taeanensis]
MESSNDFGKFGEQMAVEHLLGNGYAILERNYRYLKAEVDIIARKGDTLAIVEVKSRNMGFLEDILDTVNAKKVKLLTMAADHYVQENDLDVEVRFDVITVIKTGSGIHLEHLENAFFHF